MDVDNLTETMNAAHLHDVHDGRGVLPFCPPTNASRMLKALNNIPTFLFRVASPYFDGETNETWVRSESSKRGNTSSLEDIFHGLNDTKRRIVAQTLNKHLRWWPKEDLEDNFISWTSSLLFALQYINYLHLSSNYTPNLEETNLYVVDTTLFPGGTFARDLDLIQEFELFDNHPPVTDLRRLSELRTHPSYYFGEYLSQGRMEMADRCQVISATLLMNDGRVSQIQPQFKDIATLRRMNEKPGWPTEVQRLRRVVWSSCKLPRLTAQESISRISAVKEIIKDLGSEWKLPLAMYFMALIGPDLEIEDQETTADNSFFEYLDRATPPSENLEEKRKDLSMFKLSAPGTMPELKRVEVLIHQVQKYIRLKKELDRFYRRSRGNSSKFTYQI
ncbi:hypothetical protein BDV38DRAFT_288860 [Aspergillus pseudotamarii]|uniref:DUF7587 domain-containing protein n=1 Tax=Aspergillus pseudotamarii TaxID=132259 RepID=A0A5N6SC85_ASPPS|nr:uncharacterized protein BDV38DRAFT_288860 [Aspergillus pseudotamarii]KAE8131261.1 hypothetical protein BDV38DRAFT_288860 [Aspergillus pseudotamarii]